jgi:hypothetical protein
MRHNAQLFATRKVSDIMPACLLCVQHKETLKQCMWTHEKTQLIWKRILVGETILWFHFAELHTWLYDISWWFIHVLAHANVRVMAIDNLKLLRKEYTKVWGIFSASTMWRV